MITKLRKYVLQYIDDIFVEFGKQPSIHLILINIDTSQYFFNIFQYFTIHNIHISEKKFIFFLLQFYKYSTTNDNLSIFFNIYQYINKYYIIDGKNNYFLNTFTGGNPRVRWVWFFPLKNF
jgi:hypothetical protein